MVNAELTFQNTLISGALVALAWRLLKFFAKHPFDNLPGPPSPSLFFGPCRIRIYQILVSRYESVTGNIKQLNTSQGWAFHQALADNYGQVVKYRGFGNVSPRQWWPLPSREADN